MEGLNTWLNNWQLKITGQPIKGEDANKGTKRDGNADYDSDRGWLVGDSENDSDSGESDDDTGLHNTLLVTGPEGVSSYFLWLYAENIHSCFSVSAVDLFRAPREFHFLLGGSIAYASWLLNCPLMPGDRFLFRLSEIVSLKGSC